MKAYYFLFISVMFVSSQAASQTNLTNDLRDFEILVENTDEGLILTSRRGSAWTELTFSLKQGDVQAVDEYGMTEKDNVSAKVNPDLANFLFTVTKTEDKVELKGMEGTSWIELFFTLREDHQVTIDQNGYNREK